MQHARPIIEHLLTKGKLEAAIEGSLILCRHYADQERGSTVAQHSARYHTLMGDFHAGTINDDDYRPERARINRAMLEVAHAIPADWTDEALKQAGFSPQAYDKATGTQQQKGRGWWLALGVLGLLLVLGIGLREYIFPKKEPLQTQTEVPKNPSDSPQQQTQQPAQEAPANTKPTIVKKTDAKTRVQPQKQPSQLPPIQEKPPASTSTTLATSDERFRSYGKSMVANDMELGYMGSKKAFRNVRNKEILCCYTDAEPFSGGKAWVSKDGVNYFYIDNKGKKVD